MKTRHGLTLAALLSISFPVSAALHILSATWGQPGGGTCDATQAITAQCEGKSNCTVYADNRTLCHHPFQGWKEAIVKYTCDGTQFIDAWPETAQIALPAHDLQGGGHIPTCPGPAQAGLPNDGRPDFDRQRPHRRDFERRPNRPFGELLQNPDLRGSTGWTLVGGPGGWYKPSNGNGEVSFVSDGIRFRSEAGNTRAGVLQNLEKDVTSCASLVLSARVRADEHRLTGTGYNGREAPIAVFVKYTDTTGMVHEQLSENPNEPRNMFWNGFYYLDPTAPSIGQHGTRVNQGSWYHFSVDLMLINPRPKTIHFVGAEGGGWPVRDGRLGNLSLQCR